MTIELPNNAIASAASKRVDRRTLLKAGAWAAPVLVLTTAAPAMAASIEPVPAAQLTVSGGTLSNSGAAGVLGPLAWDGGTISWSRSTPGQPTTASVSYNVALVDAAGVSHPLVSNATTIINGSTFAVPAISYGATGLAPGTYTVTLTAFGSDGSKSGQASVVLVAPPVPVAQLSVSAYTLSNLNAGGTPGPLSWAGGQIGWWSAPSTGPTVAAVSYTAILTGPGGLSQTISSGTVNIDKYGSYTIPAVQWGTKPILGGDYRVTLTATSTGTTAPVQSNLLKVIAPVAAATPTVVKAATGNKHNVTLAFTGPAGALVDISVTQSSNVTWITAFPATATIAGDGTVSLTREVNATGNTAGTATFTFSGTYVSVTPTKFTNVPIPTK